MVAQLMVSSAIFSSFKTTADGAAHADRWHTAAMFDLVDIGDSMKAKDWALRSPFHRSVVMKSRRS